MQYYSNPHTLFVTVRSVHSNLFFIYLFREYVFSEEVNKKEVTVNGANSNKKSVRITIILHTLFAIISLLLYIVSYTVLCDLKITFLYFRRAV